MAVLINSLLGQLSQLICFRLISPRKSVNINLSNLKKQELSPTAIEDRFDDTCVFFDHVSFWLIQVDSTNDFCPSVTHDCHQNS